MKPEPSHSLPPAGDTAQPIRFATSRDGTRIAWTQRGSGRPLICVGAIFNTIGSPVLELTVAKAQSVFPRRIIYFDRRGSGKSDRQVEHSIERYADDVEAVADAAGLADFRLFAVYVGVLESLEFVARSNRVSKALFSEPMLGGPGWEKRTAFGTVYSLIDKDIELFWKVMAQSLWGWGNKIQGHGDMERVKQEHDLFDMKGRLDAVEQADIREIVGEVRTKCLIVYDAHNDFIKFSEAPGLARLLPDCELMVNDGTPLQWGSATIEAITAFLAENDELSHPRVEIRNAPAVLAKLSPREAEILEMIASGTTNKDIADAISVSHATVTRHIANIYAKLGVHNRVEATTWAVKHSGG